MFCSHQWVAIASQIEHFQHGDETNILLKCRSCGNVKTKTIGGGWTAQQLSIDVEADQ